MNAYLLNVNYVCSIGGTFCQDVTIRVSDGTFDLSDYTAKADIKKNGVIKDTMTCTIIGDTLTLSMTPMQTKIFDRGNYEYDVKLIKTNDANKVFYPIGGEIHFETVITE